jgi:tRNA(fMet)-specific endonuclease VapC
VSFLLDTDILSAHLRGHALVSAQLLLRTGQLSTSAVTLAELKTWLYRGNTPQRYRDGLALLMAEIAVLPVDEAVAERFGDVGARLLDAGTTIATPDLLIAATSLVHNLTLVTGNVRHFSAVPGLRIENWLGP